MAVRGITRQRGTYHGYLPQTGFLLNTQHHGAAGSKPQMGNGFVSVRKDKSSQGQLVIQNVQTFEEKVLSDQLRFSYDIAVGVKWAPDSSAVLS